MPQAVEVSIDEFIGKRKLSTHDGVVYRAAKKTKTFDAATRSATFVMTDETVDSYGDIVKAKGANLDRFEANPICLLNHRSDLILGTWPTVERKPKALVGKAVLASEGTAPHVDMAYNLLSQDILRGASIGFMPTKVERRLDDDGEPMWSYIIHEWELYECSIVSIPANPAALAKSVKEGNMLARDLLEEVLDTYTKTPAGLIVPIEEYEAAHKDATGDKTTVLTSKIELDTASLDRLEGITKRMEAAAEKVAKGSTDPIEEINEPAVDEIHKGIQMSVEKALEEFAPQVDEVDEPERKSALSKLIDGIRSVFAPAEPPAPERADPSVKEALRKEADEIAARYADAA